jgi:hypothetical protein
MSEEKVIVYHRPDWHPSLNEIIGDFVGEAAYVTEMGTIRLLGPIHEDPDFPKTKSSSRINGPTLLLTAQSSLGLL